MTSAVCRVYEDLDALGVDVAEVPMKKNTAIAFEDNFIAIDPSRCSTENTRYTVLAHEAGHFISGAFYPAKCRYAMREQAEHRAFAASVHRYLPVDEIRQAMRAGYTASWQLAEYFCMDEDYIKKALHYWTECRGVDFNENK